MKEDASILCDSEFRAQALVRQSDERLGGQANEKYLHQDHPTTAQAKDETSASKKNYLPSADLNYHASLNKRNELVSSCRHRNRALLRNNWTKHFNLLPRLLCKFLMYINDACKYP